MAKQTQGMIILNDQRKVEIKKLPYENGLVERPEKTGCWGVLGEYLYPLSKKTYPSDRLPAVIRGPSYQIVSENDSMPLDITAADFLIKDMSLSKARIVGLNAMSKGVNKGTKDKIAERAALTILMIVVPVSFLIMLIITYALWQAHKLPFSG